MNGTMKDTTRHLSNEM